MMKIMDNRGEEHEWMLIMVALLSLITFKKIKKIDLNYSYLQIKESN
ncbi:hypothetical protein [Oceanobacillus locisalsi]|uniref:Uncharacterized protein n=1 Tax=Oceanobacillus locisalsi TaxID=546107 RepID=A0ABW3NN14_9BACI